MWLQALWATKDCGLFLTVLKQRIRRRDCSTVLGAPGRVVWLNAQCPSSGHLGGFREADGGISHIVRSEGLKAQDAPVRPILGAGAKPLSLSSPRPQVSLFLILMAVWILPSLFILVSLGCHPRMPQTGHLNNKNIFTSSFGGQKSKIQVLVGSVSPDVSLAGRWRLLCTHNPSVSVCLISPSYKDTSQTIPAHPNSFILA